MRSYGRGPTRTACKRFPGHYAPFTGGPIGRITRYAGYQKGSSETRISPSMERAPVGTKRKEFHAHRLPSGISDASNRASEKRLQVKACLSNQGGGPGQGCNRPGDQSFSWL